MTAAIDDGELLRRETLRARSLGFRGKLCIHPNQIPHVHAALLPTFDEIDWAKSVMLAVSESRGSATTKDGKMVDVPVMLRAQDILDTAGIVAD